MRYRPRVVKYPSSLLALVVLTRCSSPGLPVDGGDASRSRADVTDAYALGSDASDVATGVDAVSTDAPRVDAPSAVDAVDVVTPVVCPVAPRDIPSVGSSTSGHFVTLSNVPATRLANTRTVTVYVPDGPGPFPVVYAQDGQNLFDPTRAAFGVAWNLGQAADALQAEGLHVLIVGVDNTANRIGEYTPVADPANGGGQGDDYVDFLMHDLKPLIDARFPTRCDADHTAVLGSSLGGLIAFHAGRMHPEVFGRVAAMSPSFWWDNGWTLAQYAMDGGGDPRVLWLDAGTGEETPAADGTSVMINNLRAVRDRALARGHTFNVDLGYREAEHMAHNEYAWSQRVRDALRFLWGVPSPAPTVGYVWALQNPIAVGASTSTVLQMTFADGRRMTLANGNVGGTAVGDTPLTASFGGITATGTLRVLGDPTGWTEQVFEVDVPTGVLPTDAIDVTGNVPALGTWDPSMTAMLHLTGTRWRASALVSTANVQYKYTRGAWASVEVNADGTDAANRTVDGTTANTTFDTVARWHDR